ncbi:hypothetical protein THAOC_31519 [Thalassiosira oceanica]|uniref:Protein kinase domain-containing protein n=1 Tax=Thalassiosira oceanica TaxID=159749 RepID=K0R937_THAOC|nr:hypothetical protein THAOC_31519 [Thalassiosira oceanica]|eukprot:EJK49590.1 hypothetical protein THAOC_31519 [Thalassiosira oceanica]
MYYPYCRTAVRRLGGPAVVACFTLSTSSTAESRACRCEETPVKSEGPPLVQPLPQNFSPLGGESSVSSGASPTARRHRWTVILGKWARWGGAARSNDTDVSSSSWWCRFQSVFIALRGLEIVLRLAPLAVLAPTAWLVDCVSPRRNELESDGDKPALTRQFTRQFQSMTSLQERNMNSGNWASNLSWRYTLYSLQNLGPAFVKLGQWAATRRDLFPPHVCNRLSQLHDTVITHPFRYTHQALVDAFGDDYEHRGLVLRRGRNDEGTVIGSGSAAQVYKGTMTHVTDSGSYEKTVAVKVLHPNTKQLVERDLALMQCTADLIDRLVPIQMVKMLSLPRAAKTFSDVLRQQTDLRIEGRNLITFRENFQCDDGTVRIVFPRPEEGWVSERVLVEDFMDGAVSISAYLLDDSEVGRKIRKKLAGPLLRAFLKMVFTDNFLHSDLHPGNVLVKATKSSKNPLRTNYTLVFLDAGISTSLRPNDRKNLKDLFRAIVMNDGYKAGSLMVERARYERCSSLPEGKHFFASGVAEIVDEFHDRKREGLTLGAVRIGALLARVLDLCRTYGVEIDPEMSSVVVSMLVLEGLGRSLDPDLNLMKAAIPFLIGRV